MQRTVAKRVEAVGIGLHKGVPVRLALEPLPENSGIVFYRQDTGTTIMALPSSVVDTKMATVIGKDGVVVSTIEHLLSALAGNGIDNVRVVLDNDEIPIMDGSSASFCMMIDEAGVETQNEPKKLLVIKKEVEVRDGDKFVKISPSNAPEYRYEIRFDHPAIASQTVKFVFTKENYKDQISRARTFGFLKEVQYLRSIGLAQGGSLENAIVLDDKKILNEGGLRFDNEFVRHKVLDAIGDMVLLGSPFIGVYESFAGSHHLNHLLTKKVLEDESNYEFVTLTQGAQPQYELAFA